jgi:restriction endonuclease S subunit
MWNAESGVGPFIMRYNVVNFTGGYCKNHLRELMPFLSEYLFAVKPYRKKQNAPACGGGS